ncbi:MAG: cytochrome c [Alphaproteobacteria bacterium]|nr:cytochrome c [Alphaproteobacteria bacterium]
MNVRSTLSSALMLSALIAVSVLPAAAQEFGAGAMDRGTRIPYQGGEAIFKGVCQGCHMPDAKGIVGAGAYPALAHNPRLETAGYAIAVVVNGQKAMPALGSMMTDQQIADVVNYIRSNFNNSYKDKVAPADVKSARP